MPVRLKPVRLKIEDEPHPLALVGMEFTRRELVRALVRGDLQPGTVLTCQRNHYWLGFRNGRPGLWRVNGKSMTHEVTNDDMLTKRTCRRCGTTDPKAFGSAAGRKLCSQCESWEHRAKRTAKKEHIGYLHLLKPVDGRKYGKLPSHRTRK